MPLDRVVRCKHTRKAGILKWPSFFHLNGVLLVTLGRLQNDATWAGTKILYTCATHQLERSQDMICLPIMLALLVTQGGNSGNGSLGTGTATMPIPAADYAAKTQSLVDSVRLFVSPVVADELQNALNPTTGTDVIINYYGGDNPGMGDAGTIGINLHDGLPAFYLAVVLAHEWEHTKNAQAGSPGDPDARDPITGPLGGPCAYCAHAMLSKTDCDRIAYLSCEPVAYPLYTSDYVDEMCKRWCDVLGTVAARLQRCLQDGCTGCCGFSHVPTDTELVNSSPCCQ